jgi:hypothetical protein
MNLPSFIEAYWEGAMKIILAGASRLQKKYLLGARFAPVFAALAAALLPSHSFARGRDDCWGPAQLRASAPDAKSRDSITMLSDEDTATLLAAAAKHHNHPVVGIETIYSARYSGDAAKVLVFAFSKDCLVDRGAIPIDEWEKIFGPAI